MSVLQARDVNLPMEQTATNAQANNQGKTQTTEQTMRKTIAEDSKCVQPFMSLPHRCSSLTHMQEADHLICQPFGCDTEPRQSEARRLQAATDQ
jgi:hypothetical protein